MCVSVCFLEGLTPNWLCASLWSTGIPKAPLGLRRSGKIPLQAGLSDLVTARSGREDLGTAAC